MGRTEPSTTVTATRVASAEYYDDRSRENPVGINELIISFLLHHRMEKNRPSPRATYLKSGLVLRGTHAVIISWQPPAGVLAIFNRAFKALSVRPQSAQTSPAKSLHEDCDVSPEDVAMWDVPGILSSILRWSRTSNVDLHTRGTCACPRCVPVLSVMPGQCDELWCRQIACPRSRWHSTFMHSPTATHCDGMHLILGIDS